ncbi:MAG: hypothetical protein EP346_00080 [Bacteroidetes bacterium]|nr:MAG: hypothetical protein EP346_00080 [Bacteroidota bacterium]
MTTDNQFDPTGDSAEVEITFTSVPSDGETFTLTMGDGTVLNFTFRTTPNESGYELKRGGFMSLFISDLALSMVSNHILSKYYKITSTYDGINQFGTINLSALSLGSSYNLTLSSNPSLMSLNIVSSGITAVERLNFGIYIRIRKRKKGESEWKLVERISKPFEGIAEENLAEVLDDEFWREKLPDVTSFATIHPSSVGECIISYAESWGLPLEVKRVRDMSLKYYTNGGMSREDHFASDFYDKYLVGTVGFMSWISSSIDLFPGEVHFLSYFRKNQIPKDINLTVESIGLSGEKVISNSAIGEVNPYDTVTIRISPEDLGLDTSNLRSFKVWIEEDDVPGAALSDKIEFNYKIAQAIDSMILIYENGLGWFDTFNLRGRQIPIGNVSREKATRATELQMDKYDHFEFSESVTGQTGWNVNTGYLSKQESSRVYDLILSKKVFLVDGDALLPVEIDPPSNLEFFSSRGSRINNLDLTIQKITDNRYGAIKS